MGEFFDLLEKKKKGSLKIYLGYAAGVGKTYEMLQEGHRLKKQGMDVVIGYVEPHDRPETMALKAGLEEVTPTQVPIGERNFPEMNVDGILNRKPQIALIDEFAHTNAVGSKNKKRYQDIFQLLDSGINIITTLNIQHIESAADKVNQASQVPVQERIPDYALQRADQVVVVDISLEDLRERLRMGKIFKPPQAEIALQNFFSLKNLSFLRELCLREVAGDQVRKIEEQNLLSQDAANLAEEAVLVAISSDPTHAEILIKKAARLASQLSTRCYAVYVQKKEEAPLKINADLQRKLQNNLNLARTLGTEVETLQSDNIVEALIGFAISRKVRHAVFGKPQRTPLMDLIRGSVILSFLHDSVGIDVHIVTMTGETTSVNVTQP